MIPRETLDHIGDAATEFPLLDEATLDCLRDRWPGLHFALCSDDDVPARLSPVLARPGFNLYLVNGSEHCLTLTNDPDVAIGVVLAWMDEA
jgi:hypothetical protein